MIEYKLKDIELETSHWIPELSAKNLYNYLLKFLVCEYKSDVDLRIQIEILIGETSIRYLFYDLPKEKTRVKIKLPVGIQTKRWKIKIYNISDKTENTEISYIGVLGIPIPIGDRMR